jgi:hypothetical protein
LALLYHTGTRESKFPSKKRGGRDILKAAAAEASDANVDWEDASGIVIVKA